MKYILLSAFLLVSCKSNVDVQSAFKLAEGSYVYCDTFHGQTTRIRYEFSSPYMTKFVDTIEGENCEELIPVVREQQSFTYDFNSETFILKETKLAAKMTFYTQDEVNIRNSEAFCGYTDWSKGRSRIVTNVECGGDTFLQNEVKDYQVQLTNNNLMIDGVLFYKF